MVTTNRKMGSNCDTNKDKCKNNGKMMTGTLLPPKSEKRQVLKFRLGTCVPILRGLR